MYRKYRQTIPIASHFLSYTIWSLIQFEAIIADSLKTWAAYLQPPGSFLHKLLMAIYEKIKCLFEAELYEDVVDVSNILLTLSDHNPEMLTLDEKYDITAWGADALFFLAQYKQAENVTCDGNLKYNLHRCYTHLKMYKEAIAVLEGMSSKQRTPRVNMALARLYKHVGNSDRSVITCYREVVKECPLSLSAAQGLLSLGVKGTEVCTLLSSSTGSEWLVSWMKAAAFVASKEYSQAIQTYRLLDTKPLLRDNTRVLGAMAEAQFLSGDYSQALITLQRIRALDPYDVHLMDILAYLFYRENNRLKDLELLSTHVMSIADGSPQAWNAMGYYCLSHKKATRAVYFALKACQLDEKNVESYLLKGLALLELRKIPDATLHYREALKLAPGRYEAHKGLVECYLAAHRTREAVTVATTAYRQLNTGARSLTLYATVIARDPLQLEKAKTYLEKALKLDSSYVEAVYTMTEILMKQHRFDTAVEILRRQLRFQSTCRLHQLLGDCLHQTHDQQGALDQYSIALSLDPGNNRVKESFEQVVKSGESSMDATFDNDADGLDHSDEPEVDGSDDSPWSDIEPSQQV